MKQQRRGGEQDAGAVGEVERTGSSVRGGRVAAKQAGAWGARREKKNPLHGEQLPRCEHLWWCPLQVGGSTHWLRGTFCVQRKWKRGMVEVMVSANKKREEVRRAGRK